MTLHDLEFLARELSFQPFLVEDHGNPGRTKLARALLAVLPAVRAAEAWLSHLEQRGGRCLDGVPGELCDAIDALHLKLGGS